MNAWSEIMSLKSDQLEIVISEMSTYSIVGYTMDIKSCDISKTCCLSVSLMSFNLSIYHMTSRLRVK